MKLTLISILPIFNRFNNNFSKVLQKMITIKYHNFRLAKSREIIIIVQYSHFLKNKVYLGPKAIDILKFQKQHKNLINQRYS